MDCPFISVVRFTKKYKKSITKIVNREKIGKNLIMRRSINFINVQIGKALVSIRSLHAENSATITLVHEKELLLYSNKKQTPVSLKSLMETGKGERLSMDEKISEGGSAVTSKVLVQVACFLHRELPVRLAHRAMKLEASPLIMKSGQAVQLYNLCILSLSPYTSTQNIFEMFVTGTSNLLLNCDNVAFRVTQRKKPSLRK